MTTSPPPKRKRGRPPLEARERLFRNAGLQMIHESFRVEIADEREATGDKSAGGKGTPTELAREMTADHAGVSNETVRRAVLKPRKKSSSGV